MELPHLGKHCSEATCNKLDFLPIKCDACEEIFCNEHYLYGRHSCGKAYLKDNQVPVCPLCNCPVPVPYGQTSDSVVGHHIDNDCQRLSKGRQIFSFRCQRKGCKTKELVPFQCPQCQQNYCLKHRHTTDHQCSSSRSPATNHLDRFHGNLTEDEALARALALSMQEEPQGKLREDRDLALARQLQESEGRRIINSGGDGGRNRSNWDRCSLS